MSTLNCKWIIRAMAGARAVDWLTYSLAFDRAAWSTYSAPRSISCSNPVTSTSAARRQAFELLWETGAERDLQIEPAARGGRREHRVPVLTRIALDDTARRRVLQLPAATGPRA